MYRKKLQAISCKARAIAAMGTIVEEFAEKLETIVAPSPEVTHTEKIIDLINEGHFFSKNEMFELETEQLQIRFAKRQELLKDSLTSAEVVSLLDVKRQTLHNRVESDSLLAVLEKGNLLFPKWQFDPNGPNGTLNGLNQVLSALKGLSQYEKFCWFINPSPFLNGATPLEAIKRQRIAEVVAVAKNIGSK
jgi:hypothetical protein